MMAFTGLRWGEVTGLQASCVCAPDHRHDHPCVGVEWQLVELNGKFYLARPREAPGETSTFPAGSSTC